MELEFEKYCRVDESPTTVLPFPRRRSKVEKRRSTKGKPTFTNDLVSLEEDFREITFNRYHSASCRNIPSRTSGLEGSEVLKRGSVYQSSSEVRNSKKSEEPEGRRKIELSGSCATTFSLGILDSLCSSADEDSLLAERERSSVMSLNSEMSTASFPMANVEPCSREFLDLSSRCGTDAAVSSDGPSDIPLNARAENVDWLKLEDDKFRCAPVIDGNGIRERDAALPFHKSLSTKLALPHSPSHLESESSSTSSPKSRFSPIRKMFDPFIKSKSLRSSLGSGSSSTGLPPAQLASFRRNNTLRKSLLNDFSNTSQVPKLSPQFVKKDLCSSADSCSPAHLRGSLKLENKHGVPSFEFSLKFPEEVFVARSWKVDNALNWVYTFHSFHNRRSNASGWGLKDWNKESTVVGQMQVSCYLCTELQDAGAFDNSMVTEFVLYDLTHARQSISAQANPNQPPDVTVSQRSVGGTSADDVSDQVKLKLQQKQVTKSRSPISHPWATTDLNPSHEVAAVVIQVPFEKRESLKYKGGDAKSNQPHPILLDLSADKQIREGVLEFSSPTKVNVVTPSGNHSLPASDSRGTSPLLDRWRLGGGCDCGGWDMACPLTVFSNPRVRGAEGFPLVENQQPLELFVLGAKEQSPALTLTIIEEGQYSVDFHAQLSTLQAFSICVSILHCTEASIAVRKDRDRELLQCNSLRVYIEEEVKHLIEAVTEEEKRKVSTKKMGETPPSFKLINPPFSPIARV